MLYIAHNMQQGKAATGQIGKGCLEQRQRAQSFTEAKKKKEKKTKCHTKLGKRNAMPIDIRIDSS